MDAFFNPDEESAAKQLATDVLMEVKECFKEHVVRRQLQQEEFVFDTNVTFLREINESQTFQNASIWCTQNSEACQQDSKQSYDAITLIVQEANETPQPTHQSNFSGDFVRGNFVTVILYLASIAFLVLI